MDLTDQQLLRLYAQERTDAPFAEVVRRHLNLVYSVALRLTAGDAALAEDVAQKVFTDLARKVSRVAECASLAGWLHTHTRFVALTAMRGESRRRTREQEAFAMNESSPTEELDWDRLRPLLDEAVGQLRSGDRDAVVMRFFENKSHSEVGTALGLQENAARMRVERAVEKLRAHFLRRGITASAAVIAAAMGTNSVHAAPVGLAIKVAGVSLADAAGAGGLTATLLNAIYMNTKAKIFAAVVITTVLAGIPLGSQYYETRQLRKEISLLAAQRNSLQTALENAQARLQGGVSAEYAARNNPAPTPLAAPVASGSPTRVQLDLATVGKLYFTGINDRNFKVSPEAIALLGLTLEENAGMQTVMAGLKQRVQSYSLAKMQALAADKITDSQVIAFLEKNTGQRTVYQIPFFDKEAGESLQSWFSQSVQEVIGAERGTILAEKSKPAFSNWVASGPGMIIAFVDGVGEDGQTPQTTVMVRRQSDSGGSTTVFSPGRAVPEELAYLFEEIKENQQAPAP